jgi:hypothetical protein
MATTITIRTGEKPVVVTMSREGGEPSTYTVPANTPHHVAIPDEWTLTVADADDA